MQAADFQVMKALEATGRTAALTDREKHLIGLAVTVTRGCSVCSGGRIEKALATGVAYETILAAVDLAAAVNAGVTIRTAIEGAARNGIEQPCEGAECSVATTS
jgi:alkylhydroperoxidase/carboxymuconolactone decarboxylase family protein YurZ